MMQFSFLMAFLAKLRTRSTLLSSLSLPMRPGKSTTAKSRTFLPLTSIQMTLSENCSSFLTQDLFDVYERIQNGTLGQKQSTLNMRINSDWRSKWGHLNILLRSSINDLFTTQRHCTDPVFVAGKETQFTWTSGASATVSRKGDLNKE
jgi:hypothetical protein